MKRVLAAGALVLLLGWTTPLVARAEVAWVQGEIRLNVRTGPATEYRILDKVKTGDSVEIVGRQNSWTRIRTSTGKEGWIPAGYLEPQAPPTVRLGQLEQQVETLQASLGETEAEASTLRTANLTLTTQEAEHRKSIEGLSRENLDLKAGARWPYMITGASILVAGMMMGAVMARGSRRRKVRIKL